MFINKPILIRSKHSRNYDCIVNINTVTNIVLENDDDYGIKFYYSDDNISWEYKTKKERDAEMDAIMNLFEIKLEQ